jgi:TRAP-type C4-dicarboxylate transport system permease small subunit
VTPARLRAVLAVALLVGAGSWAVLDIREASGADPVPSPWTAAVAVALLAVAVAVAVGGLEVRRWVCGRRERPLDPLVAARIAVLAKAASYTGGGLTGWYLAQAVVLLPDLVGDRYRQFLVTLLSALSAAALAAIGLVSQGWCRRPPDDQNGPENGRRG